MMDQMVKILTFKDSADKTIVEKEINDYLDLGWHIKQMLQSIIPDSYYENVSNTTLVITFERAK